MNEELSQPAEEQAAGPLAGERLAEARRLRQMSLPDIARELHLDEPKVQALEENRFEVLGAPVFARGHLRKYAEMVGVPVDAILADYHQLTGAQSAPPVVGDSRPRAREVDIMPWVVGLPLLLVALGTAWWWLGRNPAPVAADPRPATVTEPLAAPAATAAEAQPVVLPPTVTDSEAAAPTEVTTDPAAPEPVIAEPASDAGEPPATASAPPIPGEITLQVAFSGDCWTEVTDANGNRLFFDLGRAGRTVSVSGAGPFRVLLGDSRNATLRVNGESYPLADAERRGETARLTIN